MAKNKDKLWWKTTYKATDSTACIGALQLLINDKSGKFEWSNHLDSKEVGFVYDMVSQANCFSNFSPSAAQSRWMVAILGKLKLIMDKKPKDKPAKKKTKKKVKSK